ncbi:methyl-accepting chemotaxis protein [Rubrivivax benzoatilyticus]|uniref:Chemotaxis protein n=1 Tax=Rubrivivax benzoatilyticus TaxID=316997 RepID=A0ABX0I115_9BURK|nr:methyl-accepting chemotaxis protein [Rubrivivax benzoatilyticus]EGJ11463.1 methyl-accepting chemotaxis sensory transducer [Rubrivivax benzoatilyticus JA2 = ATCC BAA-35]NHK99754.1 chemotaxis protein [Rubrivivax benzoatilyticus]NHL25627.1 chemotaxis protein [Rubrivivax benzoatilyticus]
MTELTLPSLAPDTRPRFPRLASRWPVTSAAVPAAALLAWASSAELWVSFCALALVLAAVAGDWRAERGRRERDRLVAQWANAQQALGHELVPLWAAHVEGARAQTEAAVCALTERFGGIVSRLDTTLASAGSGGDHGAAEVQLRSCRDLEVVIASLRRAMDGNTALRRAVQGLAPYVAELRSMAVEVSAIASKTNLLAINAAIEAAHAGPEGRGFGVLAQEVRKLSAQSASTGERIARDVDSISSAILKACGDAQLSETTETETLAASSQAIERVLTDFESVTRSLEDAAARLKADSQGIQAEVVESLVQLQFQDRVSQRLSHVRDNLEHLCRLASDVQGRDGEATPLDSKELLEELRRSYAMADEHAAELRRPAATEPRASAPAEEAVTFF